MGLCGRPGWQRLPHLDGGRRIQQQPADRLGRADCLGHHQDRFARVLESSDICSANRKFMFRPSVVEKNGTKYLMLGSGDREKPLDDTYWPNSYAVQNYFFMIKDMPTGPGLAGERGRQLRRAVICMNSLLEIPEDNEPRCRGHGGRQGMVPAARQDRLPEQVVTAAITVFGNTTFSTHTPATPTAGACTSNLGDARVYNVGYRDAAPRANNRPFRACLGRRPATSPVAGRGDAG